jgi:hypothetical protein
MAAPTRCCAPERIDQTEPADITPCDVTRPTGAPVCWRLSAPNVPTSQDLCTTRWSRAILKMVGKSNRGGIDDRSSKLRLAGHLVMLRKRFSWASAPHIDQELAMRHRSASLRYLFRHAWFDGLWSRGEKAGRRVHQQPGDAVRRQPCEPLRRLKRLPHKTKYPVVGGEWR